MSTLRDRPHIEISPGRWRKVEPYQGRAGGTTDTPGPPPSGRIAHGESLRAALQAAEQDAVERRDAASVSITGATPGVYLEFESLPGWDLHLTGLEALRKTDATQHVELVAVSEEVNATGERSQRAAVFVPDGQLGVFLKKLDKYVDPTEPKPNERRNWRLYDRVAKLQRAALRALWTDSSDQFPTSDDELLWLEVWLRRTDGGEVKRLRQFCDASGITMASRWIGFDARIVALVRASLKTLAASLNVMGDLAELRRAKETATFFVRESTADQGQWTLDLAQRTQAAGLNAPAVCLLDTGVNAGHPLLEGSFGPGDLHTCDPAWGGHDHDGHGTKMAGVALYGDSLVELLANSEPVELPHRLESVKILPPRGQNEPELYGALVAEAASRPEVHEAGRRRIYAMALTTGDGRDRGQPSSWSAAMDALAAGRTFDPDDDGLKYLGPVEDNFRRLFVVSAGNTHPNALRPDHLEVSDAEPVHDPAQAWNVLTVGAFTDKTVVRDAELNDWRPVAERGELSPWSTTSVEFEPAWPNKPEVVFEGGNLICNASGDVDFHGDDLALLTTNHIPAEAPLVTTEATSAATAQAARFCATIAAEYPSYWPETIRALVVHSAEWTDAMQQRMDAEASKKERGKLLRRYGYGVPNRARALRSATSSVTLVAQDVIRPFDEGSMREIHLHSLPWPKQVLADLGAATVRVRVTLSYFVEPNPGRLGWKTRYRYQSHGLRFQVKGPLEEVTDFRKRLNKAALAEDEEPPENLGDNAKWFLGPQARDRGSIHSDVLTDVAASIAERGVLAVYPVGGWWKDRKKLDGSEAGARYSLIVSIETEDVNADVWTPIHSAIAVPQPILTSS